MEIEESKHQKGNSKKSNSSQNPNNDQSISLTESIIDLPKLSNQTEINNSDIILAILEICSFNKKYNYDCSNNTKAFWERVVGEDILKKIFRNFKSETLRKYWKIIRMAGNITKFIETVKNNQKFINNPVFKLLPIINAIAAFVQTEEKNFENYFINFNAKEKKGIIIQNKDEKKEEKKSEISLIGNKRGPENPIPPPSKIDEKPEKIEEKTEDKKIEEEKDAKKMAEMDNLVNKLMEISKFSREEVVNALYGTSNNLEHAYKYLMDNEKYDKYFFVQTDDYILKNLRNKGYYLDLVNLKGEELVREREKFLGINC